MLLQVLVIVNFFFPRVIASSSVCQFVSDTQPKAASAWKILHTGKWTTNKMLFRNKHILNGSAFLKASKYLIPIYNVSARRELKN